MKPTAWIVVGLALAAAPLAVAGEQPAQKPAAAPAAGAPKGDAAAGAQGYVKYGCYQCHGRAGQGGGGGPRLGPAPLPWVAFDGYVRAPTGQMPPYTTKIVTQQQLADVYAFIAALPPPS